MKTFSKILLVTILAPIIFIEIVGVLFKFMILEPRFWFNTFEKNNVYQNLTIELKKEVETQTINGGGNGNDIKVVTDIITPDNVKNILDKNITNILDFVNQKSANLLFYIPLRIIPKDLIPVNLESLPENISAIDLANKFNISGLGANEIHSISMIGPTINYILVLGLILISLLAVFLYLVSKEGGWLIPFGILLIFDGILFFITFYLVSRIDIAFLNIQSQSRVPKVLFNYLAHPAALEFSRNLIIAAIIFCVVGIGFLFLKKTKNK